MIADRRVDPSGRVLLCEEEGVSPTPAETNRPDGAASSLSVYWVRVVREMDGRVGIGSDALYEFLEEGFDHCACQRKSDQGSEESYQA